MFKMITRQIVADDISNSSAILEQFASSFGTDFPKDCQFFFLNHPVYMVLQDKLRKSDDIIKNFLGNPIKLMMADIDSLLETVKQYPT